MLYHHFYRTQVYLGWSMGPDCLSVTEWVSEWERDVVADLTNVTQAVKLPTIVGKKGDLRIMDPSFFLGKAWKNTQNPEKFFENPEKYSKFGKILWKTHKILLKKQAPGSKIAFSNYATNSIQTDNANMAIQGNVIMQVTQSGGQLWNQCKWCHLMTKF